MIKLPKLGMNCKNEIFKNLFNQIFCIKMYSPSRQYPYFKINICNSKLCNQMIKYRKVKNQDIKPQTTDRNRPLECRRAKERPLHTTCA